MTNDRGWNDGPGDSLASDLERIRAAERERRINERAEASQTRSDRRAVEREEAARLREQAREARRIEDEQRRAALTAERGERPKRRASGSLAHTGEARVVRDTRHYTTTMDLDRLRLLAKRGASPAALAKAFGVSVEDVEEALNAA